MQLALPPSGASASAAPAGPKKAPKSAAAEIAAIILIFTSISFLRGVVVVLNGASRGAHDSLLVISPSAYLPSIRLGCSHLRARRPPPPPRPNGGRGSPGPRAHPAGP